MHLDAQGAPQATVSFRGRTDVQFGPDGPDADSLSDLYLSDQRSSSVVVLQSEVRGRVPRARLPAVTVTAGPKLAIRPETGMSSVGGFASLTVQVKRPGSFTAPWYRLTPCPSPSARPPPPPAP